jgi:hypothetical protein
MRRQPAMEPWEVAQCMNQLTSADPWFAVYGDSLTRAIFFDVATLLNGSSAGDYTHPGHGANYSDDCTILEMRPPLRRLKCGGFELTAPLPEGGGYRPGRVRPSRWASTTARGVNSCP